ncbi:MAG TPA: ATP-binding cassette domain-containing protein, partial [Acidimicrobiales bacterium]|nr:ATP-binding cassette domain-containing protein [Acidimicrobiales bacterium]
MPPLRTVLAGLVRGRGVKDPRVDESLELLDLAAMCDEQPTNLSLGQRKLVGVARALVARPRLLCLDEPAAGLDASESRILGERLRQVVDGGTTTLLIDHDMNLVLSVSDYVYVLDFGRIIAHGTPAEIRVDEAVIQAHLGRTDPTSPGHRSEVVGEGALP